MAGAGRRMTRHEVRHVDRMNLLLHGERMEGSEWIFEVPLLLHQFGIEIHGPKVFHIGIQTLHAFIVKKITILEPLRKTLREFAPSKKAGASERVTHVPGMLRAVR